MSRAGFAGARDDGEAGMVGDQVRGFDEVLAEAIRILTEAGRLRRPVFVLDEDTRQWVRDPVRTEPADFAEFLTLAVASTAANVGGVEELLVGRPGSWEADYVRNMLHSTVGFEEAQLLEHRTEPVVLTVNAEAILWDLGIGALYEESLRELQRQECAIGVPCVVRDDGVIAPVDPGSAPLTPEEQARFREDCGEGWLRPGARVTFFRTPAEEDEFARLWLLEERVEELRERETAEFGEAFRASVLAELEREPIPGLRVPVEVRVQLDNVGPAPEQGFPFFAVRLFEAAWLSTPLPGSGLRLLDYPPGADVARVEREAGRLPHQRL
jgi:hypothetical protein